MRAYQFFTLTFALMFISWGENAHGFEKKHQFAQGEASFSSKQGGITRNYILFARLNAGPEGMSEERSQSIDLAITAELNKHIVGAVNCSSINIEAVHKSLVAVLQVKDPSTVRVRCAKDPTRGAAFP